MVRTVDAHLGELLAAVTALDPFPIGIVEARGCVTAADVVARWPLPAFPSATVDGYAVRQSDFAEQSESGWEFRVVDVLLAGNTPQADLEPGTAVRVIAGGPVPAGTDAVVPVADTDGGMVAVQIRKAPLPFENLLPAGRDVPAGSVIVPTGELVDAQLIGLLAASGCNNVFAHPRPRVVVVSVGDDLVEVGADLAPGQSVDANGPMVSALAAQAGASVYRVGPVSEAPTLLQRTLEDQLVRSDLIVVTTGQATQTPEQVRHVLQQIGEGDLFELLMQPGSLHGFGVIGEERIPVIVLPAMPLAAIVAFEVFVRPVIRRLQGLDDGGVKLTSARLAVDLNVGVGRRNYLAAAFTESDSELLVSPLQSQDSHLIGGLAAADCIIAVPDLVGRLAAGDAVDVIELRERRP